MTTFTEEYLDALLATFAGKRIAVLGDLMVDRYTWGTVRRVATDSAVPVFALGS